ncbi:MAG: NAD(P)/FAD-dependent oxidoreductase [Desulfobacterales bacterium]|jgi:flavin-dependent dehydrogenase|nr:NAD(P)/FAD-dependent oxidoreductase [Desulfobacterales bacterium]
MPANDAYDVVVIGGGFGGSVAAKKCADAGLKTLMIERSQNIGEKVISGLTIPIYGFLFGPDFIRDGNPPIERPADGIINYIIKDIDSGDIDIDDSLRVPRPFSPVIAFGYNAYCKPFCQWQAQKAIESGAEVQTSTTVLDVIKENGAVAGVLLEDGRQIKSKIVIDAEGSQGLVAVKAGIREKYPPEAISLADTYDYEMDKKDVDRIFGYSLRFCWGWDEQKIAPPLGHGNGLMVWPYRNSVHFMQDHCLRLDGIKAPNLKKRFQEYHDNITSKLPWWRDEVAPKSSVRARMWEGFEIFVGLDSNLKNMPNHDNGILLVGDAAGLESTELCDGVPAAWFSADMAADVAIEAIRAGNTQKDFLKKYDERIKAHPIIQWSISGKNRFNLRYAQEKHDERLLKKCVHLAWGLGQLTHSLTPLLKMSFLFIKKDPRIITKWIKMFFRYYQNWLHNAYDYSEREQRVCDSGNRPKLGEMIFKICVGGLDLFLRILSPLIKILAVVGYHLSGLANPVMKLLLPIIRPIYLFLRKPMYPIGNWIAEKMIDFVYRADPSLFETTKGSGHIKSRQPG